MYLTERRGDLMNHEMRELSEYIKVFPGINQSRLSEKEKSELSLYDLKSFDEDFKKATAVTNKQDSLSPQATLETGDVVINTSNYLATIVDETNHGKTITTNFLRVAFINEALDKTYFMYLFNENIQMQQQKVIGSQGTTTVMKLSIKAIESMKFPLLPIQKQQYIGLSYRKLLFLKKQLNQLSQSYSDLTLKLLESSIQGDYINES